nr:unnamed protein product [Digitaria exilis]
MDPQLAYLCHVGSNIVATLARWWKLGARDLVAGAQLWNLNRRAAAAPAALLLLPLFCLNRGHPAPSSPTPLQIPHPGAPLIVVGLHHDVREVRRSLACVVEEVDKCPRNAGTSQAHHCPGGPIAPPPPTPAPRPSPSLKVKVVARGELLATVLWDDAKADGCKLYDTPTTDTSRCSTQTRPHKLCPRHRRRQSPRSSPVPSRAEPDIIIYPIPPLDPLMVVVKEIRHFLLPSRSNLHNDDHKENNHVAGLALRNPKLEAKKPHLRQLEAGTTSAAGGGKYTHQHSRNLRAADTPHKNDGKGTLKGPRCVTNKFFEFFPLLLCCQAQAVRPPVQEVRPPVTERNQNPPRALASSLAEAKRNLHKLPAAHHTLGASRRRLAARSRTPHNPTRIDSRHHDEEEGSAAAAFRPIFRARLRPSEASLSSLSVSLPGGPALSVVSFLSSWASRTPLSPSAARLRVAFLGVLAGDSPGLISRRPDPLSFKPQTLGFHRRRVPSRLIVELRVKVRKLPSPLSLSLSLSRVPVELVVIPSRRSPSQALTNPKNRLPAFPASSQANHGEKPSSLASDSLVSGEVPAERRRAPPRFAPFDLSQNDPFEGDQDQVYEEEPPQYFEQGKRAVTSISHQYQEELSRTEYRHLPRRRPGTEQTVVVGGGPTADPRLNVLARQNQAPPPPPPQPAMDPAMQQFLATQMQLIQQLTQTVANLQAQQNQQPPPPPEPVQPPRDHHRQFLSQHPPTYSHSADPLDADDWLKNVAKKLNIAQCTDREKELSEQKRKFQSSSSGQTSNTRYQNRSGGNGGHYQQGQQIQRSGQQVQRYSQQTPRTPNQQQNHSGNGTPPTPQAQKSDGQRSAQPSSQQGNKGQQNYARGRVNHVTAEAAQEANDVVIGIFRPIFRARLRPSEAALSSLSVSLPGGPALSVVSFLSPPSAARLRVAFLGVLAGDSPGLISRRPDPLSFKPQTLGFRRRRVPSRLIVELRVKVRKLPSPLSLSLSLSRVPVELAVVPSRRSPSQALTNPKNRLPAFPASSQANHGEKPSSLASDSLVSGEVPAERRRAPPRFAPFDLSHLAEPVRVSAGSAGDQDQVYEEEPSQYFEQGKRALAVKARSCTPHNPTRIDSRHHDEEEGSAAAAFRRRETLDWR